METRAEERPSRPAGKASDETDACVVRLLDREGYTLEGSTRGAHFSTSFDEESIAAEVPQRLLEGGSIEGWRIEQGRRYWARTSVTPITGDSQRLGFTCVTHDLTELARRRADHETADARFRAVMQYSAVGLALLDLDGRWLQVNQAICDLLGYSSEELMPLTFQALTHPDDLDLDLEYVQALTKGEIPSYRLEKRYIRKDGEVVWGLLAVALVRASADSAAYFISQIQDITHLKQVELQLHQERDKLSHTALHDALTGLPNRRKFEEAMLNASPTRGEVGHALCFLDLDRFKIINDTAGHAAGDALLRSVAQKIAGAVRSSDLVARLGGDEFAIVLWRCSLERASEILTELLRDIESMPFVWDGRTHRVTTSIGLAAFDASEPVGLPMQRADVACYAAKNAGRNRLSVYESAHGTVAMQHRELIIAAELKSSIAADRFRLYIQPIQSLHHSSRYYEVLLRMVDGDGELISPALFIPAAERYDLMADIDRWVLREVLERRAAELSQIRDLTLSVNLSAASLSDGTLFSTVRDLLARSPLKPHQIVFEITETAVINDFATARVILKQLRELGCKIALDDFGVGFSSFSYLRMFPVDTVKIDGSFVRNAATGGLDRAIVLAMCNIVREIGATTVAECVETTETLECMRELGVGYVQGYGIARPGPIEQLFDEKSD